MNENTLTCPVSGQAMAFDGATWSVPNGDKAKSMPRNLEHALQNAGYNPWAFYALDWAVDWLAAAVVNGRKAALLVPARDQQGKFGGWAWQPVDGFEISELPTVQFEIEFNPAIAWKPNPTIPVRLAEAE